MHLRKELYHVIPRSKKSKQQLSDHFNTIEGSIDRSWRDAVEVPHLPRKKYSKEELVKAKIWSDKLYEQ